MIIELEKILSNLRTFPTLSYVRTPVLKGLEFIKNSQTYSL